MERQKTKHKHYVMTIEDVEWLQAIRRAANSQRLGTVSGAQVLHDLIAYAQARGYAYGDR